MNESPSNEPGNDPGYSSSAKVIMVVCVELALLVSLAPMGLHEVLRLHLTGTLGMNLAVLFWIICIVAGCLLASAKDDIFSLGLLGLIGLLIANLSGCSMILKGLSIDG